MGRSCFESVVAGLMFAVAVVGVPGCAAGQHVEVGVNPRTGKGIMMPMAPKHPVLPVGGFNQWYATERYRKGIGQVLDRLSKDNAAGLEKQMADIVKLAARPDAFLGQMTWLGRDGQVAPERYAECLGKGLDALLAAGKVDSKAYPALYYLMLKHGKPSPAQAKKHAQALKGGMFPEGKLDLRKCDLATCDMLWDTGVLTKGQQEQVEAYHLSRAGVGVNWGCNNGRWGWVRLMDTAAVFANAELMRLVLEDLQHWLGHDIYPDGGNHDNPAYAYCHHRRPQVFDRVASFLEGLDPQTFAVPSVPDPFTTNRDGFEDPSLRDLHAATGIAWRSIDTWNRWRVDRAAPDGTIFARGDSNPDGVANPGDIAAKKYERDVPVRSTNLSSLVILRGGGEAEGYNQGLRDAPKGTERAEMLYACLDGEATDPCHNHMNMLQLLVWGKGAWLAGDNGCRINWLSGTYDREVGTYNYKTYAHNTVTVDQREQYVANSTQLFFGDQPEFRVAAMDGGYVYDGVFHQRTVAMTDRYVLDMNLLPPRSDSPEDAVHTFDYMLQGTGRFDHQATKFSAGRKIDKQHKPMNGKGRDDYLQWPNLTFIYPFINWSTPGVTSGNWDLAWGLEQGPSMRVVILNDEPMKVASGMAQLGIRGGHTFDTLVLGVPKILARYTGRGANFLALMEPFNQKSQISQYTKLDDQAARVELADGSIDVLLLQRQSPSYVFVRTRDGRVASMRFFDGPALSVGGKVLLKASEPLTAAGVMFVDGKAHVAATAERACTLTIACEGTVAPSENVKKDAVGFTVTLQPGKNRVTVSGQGVNGIALAPEALSKLHAEIPPRAPKEVDAHYPLARAKRLWQENYMWPVIYHDGAYKGQKGTDSHWSVDVTDDGKVVTGTHFGTVECFDRSGRKLWIYKADGRCAWNCGWSAWHLQRPLHISPDGSRVIAGSELGTAHFLDGDGRYIWRTNIGSRISDICPDSAWSKFAVAAEKGIFVLDRGGKKLVEMQTDGRAYEIRLADDGSFAARVTKKIEADPAAKGLIAGETSGNAVVIARFDPSGKERWFVASPPAAATSRSAGAKAVASAPLNGQRFASFDMTPDGRRIMAASSNTRLYAYDGRNGRMQWETKLHDTASRTLATSADGNTVYAYGIGGVLLCYDGNGRPRWRYRTGFGGYCIDATADGKRACIPSATGDVQVLAREKRVITRSPVHTVEPMGVAISPNGKYFAVGGVGYDLLLFENPD